MAVVMTFMVVATLLTSQTPHGSPAQLRNEALAALIKLDNRGHAKKIDTYLDRRLALLRVATQ